MASTPTTRRAMAACLCLVLAVVGLGAVLTRDSSCETTNAGLAAYEWRTDAWDTRAEAETVIRAAETMCLATVYVDITGLAVEADRQDLERSLNTLLEVSADSPVEIGALAGDPWWGSEDGLVDAALVLQRVHAINASSGVEIESLHLDVEPWGLDEWADLKVSLSSDYLDFVDGIVRVRDELDGPTIDLAFLVPYWFDGSNGEAPEVDYRSTLGFPFQHLEATAPTDVSWIVMAYRDRAEGEGGVLDLLSEELDMSVTVGLALETVPVEPESITFAEEGWDEMHRAIAEILAAEPGLTEIVVNDLESLIAMHGAVDRSGTPSR